LSKGSNNIRRFSVERIKQVVSEIGELDADAMRQARERQDQLTKPQGSLGVLEDLSVKIAGITSNPLPEIGDKAIIVMAADHGVVEEGISAYPQEVTPQMVLNFVRGGAGINVLSRHVDARVIVVDIGVAQKIKYQISNTCPERRRRIKNTNQKSKIENTCLVEKKVRFGTDNMAKEPAMSREEAIASIEVGIDIVEEEIKKGLDIIGIGDMGIGNTTPSSAIVAVFSRGKVPRLPGRRGHPPFAVPVEAVVGKGTGITDGQLETKVRVIKEALKINQPDASDPIDVLAKVGGLEIGGITGCVLGAAANRIPVVIDGFISGAAALMASRIAPRSTDYMIASHVSIEPGHRIILEMLGLKPMLYMDMRLGEGTGAALGISLAEAATKVLSEMATFEEAQVSTKHVEVDL
jgi:nicotinate-nucleotide--dimethylbenzimidazole phosphoribosyltransferase